MLLLRHLHLSPGAEPGGQAPTDSPAPAGGSDDKGQPIEKSVPAPSPAPKSDSPSADEEFDFGDFRVKAGDRASIAKARDAYRKQTATATRAQQDAAELRKQLAQPREFDEQKLAKLLGQDRQAFITELMEQGDELQRKTAEQEAMAKMSPEEQERRGLTKKFEAGEQKIADLSERLEKLRTAFDDLPKKQRETQMAETIRTDYEKLKLDPAVAETLKNPRVIAMIKKTILDHYDETEGREVWTVREALDDLRGLGEPLATKKLQTLTNQADDNADTVVPGGGSSQGAAVGEDLDPGPEYLEKQGPEKLRRLLKQRGSG